MDLRSIYELQPIETGGSRNRQGLTFQDHVALGFCFEMLSDSNLCEVWCETQDDITLIWQGREKKTVEFVQAKSNELDQLWTVSGLCKRDSSKHGSSIVEKSLAYDRCTEDAIFRVVTIRPFSSALAALTEVRDSPARSSYGTMQTLQSEFNTKLGAIVSPKGTTCGDWVSRTLLDARHSELAVANANIIRLQQWLEGTGVHIFQDQLREIYARMLAKIAEISQLDARRHVEKKRLNREVFTAALKDIVKTYLHPESRKGGKVLAQKMKAAGLPKDTIVHAQEQRRSYRGRTLTPKYLTVHDRPMLEEEVAAILNTLKAKLDSGEIVRDGPGFHSLCLETLTNFRNSLPESSRPSLADLHGCMYNITDRCLHRFRTPEA